MDPVSIQSNKNFQVFPSNEAKETSLPSLFAGLTGPIFSEIDEYHSNNRGVGFPSRGYFVTQYSSHDRGNLEAIFSGAQNDRPLSFVSWLGRQLVMKNKEESESSDAREVRFSKIVEDLGLRYKKLGLNFSENCRPDFSLQTPENLTFLANIIFLGEFFSFNFSLGDVSPEVYAESLLILSKFMTYENSAVICKELELIGAPLAKELMRAPQGLKVVLEEKIPLNLLNDKTERAVAFLLDHSVALKNILDSGGIVNDLFKMQELQLYFLLARHEGIDVSKTPDGALMISLKKKLQLTCSQIQSFFKNPWGLSALIAQGVSFADFKECEPSKMDVILQYSEGVTIALKKGVAFEEILKTKTEKLNMLCSTPGALEEVLELLSWQELIDKEILNLQAVFKNPSGLKKALKIHNISSNELLKLPGINIREILYMPEGFSSLFDNSFTWKDLCKIDPYVLGVLLRNPKGLEVAIQTLKIPRMNLLELSLDLLEAFLSEPQRLRDAPSYLYSPLQNLNGMTASQFSAFMKYGQALNKVLPKTHLSLNDLKKLDGKVLEAVFKNWEGLLYAQRICNIPFSQLIEMEADQLDDFLKDTTILQDAQNMLFKNEIFSDQLAWLKGSCRYMINKYYQSLEKVFPKISFLEFSRMNAYQMEAVFVNTDGFLKVLDLGISFFQLSKMNYRQLHYFLSHAEKIALPIPHLPQWEVTGEQLSRLSARHLFNLFMYPRIGERKDLSFIKYARMDFIDLNYFLCAFDELGNFPL